VVATPGCSGTPGLPVPPGPQRLTELLLEGAAAHGFTGELWTVARITQLIGRQFGADYHPSHVWWLLRHRLGWSPHWQGSNGSAGRGGCRIRSSAVPGCR
jgi:transposase